MKKRGEAEISTTWRLEDMVPDNETWEKQLKEASDQLETYGEFKGKLAETAENLYQCLKFDDEFSLKAERLYVYARMRSDEDTANDLYQDMFSRAQLLNIRASENSSYMVPEILSIPEETLKKYRSTHSGLKHFDRLLDQLLKRKSHTLSKTHTLGSYYFPPLNSDFLLIIECNYDFSYTFLKHNHEIIGIPFQTTKIRPSHSMIGFLLTPYRLSPIGQFLSL